MDFEILEWDSEIFEIPTALIKKQISNEASLNSLVSDLGRAGIRLAYLFSPFELGNYVAEHGGYLADRKTTFYLSSENFSKKQPISIGAIAPYELTEPTDEMVSLAIQSGAYSRFAKDPHFPKEKFIQLYTIWIRRSVRKEMAEEVLVSWLDTKLNGFITLRSKEGVGEIGLIAVDTESRRMGIGRQLILSAFDWCYQRKLDGCRVVTQADNIPACQLYLKCGFEIQAMEFVYHFWLNTH